MENDIKSSLQKASRQEMHSIWEKAKKNELEDLNEEEKLLAQIMLEHEDEFFNEFEFSDVMDEVEYDPESETNPFLHIIFHSVIEKQLHDKEPIEAYQFYLAMRNKKTARHDTIHMIANILAHFLYQTLKENKPFDEATYRRVLKLYKDKKPEKVWSALEKGLDHFMNN